MLKLHKTTAYRGHDRLQQDSYPWRGTCINFLVVSFAVRPSLSICKLIHCELSSHKRNVCTINQFLNTNV